MDYVLTDESEFVKWPEKLAPNINQINHCGLDYYVEITITFELKKTYNLKNHYQY